MSRTEEIRAREKAATDGPWAWEQYGEKVNCFRVGVAVDKDDNPVSGHVETEKYDEEADVFVEDIIFRETIGDQEGATVNYKDADFIAHAREDIPYLLSRVERLEVALKWLHDFFTVDASMSVLEETLQKTLLAQVDNALEESDGE